MTDINFSYKTKGIKHFGVFSKMEGQDMFELSSTDDHQALVFIERSKAQGVVDILSSQFPKTQFKINRLNISLFN